MKRGGSVKRLFPFKEKCHHEDDSGGENNCGTGGDADISGGKEA